MGIGDRSASRDGRVGYDLALAAARARNDAKAVAALEQVGPPPYARFDQFLVRQQYTNPPGLPASLAEEAAGAAMFKWFITPPPANARYVAPIPMPAGFNPETNFISTVQEMFEIYQDFDARTVGLSFAVPVFIFQGEMDINTPGLDLALILYRKLEQRGLSDLGTHALYQLWQR